MTGYFQPGFFLTKEGAAVVSTEGAAVVSTAILGSDKIFAQAGVRVVLKARLGASHFSASCRVTPLRRA